MKGFILKTIVEDKIPKTKITRKNLLKKLPVKTFDGSNPEMEASRYVLRALFMPWYSKDVCITFNFYHDGVEIHHGFRKENMIVRINGDMFTEKNTKWRLRSRAKWVSDGYERWRDSITPTNIEKVNSIVLEAIIKPSEIEKFNSTDYHYKSSDILEKKCGVSINRWNDREIAIPLEIVAEAVYFNKQVEEIANSNIKYFDFDYVLNMHILNPTPKRVWEAIKSYIPIHDYFVSKFPIFMEAAQLIEKGFHLQKFRDKHYKVSEKNKKYLANARQEFFQEADKRLKDLKFPGIGLEKYLRI
jgi:hypothetical protein